jgi:hypothetical protein
MHVAVFMNGDRGASAVRALHVANIPVVSPLPSGGRRSAIRPLKIYPLRKGGWADGLRGLRRF